MSATSERPTLSPAYDVDEFAKDSDARLAAASEVNPIAALLEPDSDVRITTRPQLGEFLGLESWAREASGLLVVTMAPAALRRLPLDHRAGFLLSLMDGSIDLETLVEISSMERDEVLRIVRDLQETGVVAFK